MPLFKKGDVVNIFQMSYSHQLIFEGKATVLKWRGGNEFDEYYKVRFHGRDGKPALGEEYDRFVDREGQADPEAYVIEFNKRIGV